MKKIECLIKRVCQKIRNMDVSHEKYWLELRKTEASNEQVFCQNEKDRGFFKRYSVEMRKVEVLYERCFIKLTKKGRPATVPRRTCFVKLRKKMEVYYQQRFIKMRNIGESYKKC